MSTFVYVPPYAPPAPPVAPFRGYGSVWTGADGSVWDLTDPDGGVFMTNQGVRGLLRPEYTRFTSKSAGVAGSRHRGSRAEERSVYWPVFVFSDAGSQEWVELDRAFARSFDPDVPGFWTVTQPSGEKRYLSCRLVDDGGAADEIDPVAAGWRVYGINLVATDPYWYGEPISSTWSGIVEAGRSTFPIRFNDRNFRRKASSTLGTVTMTNPGDVDAWPVLTIEGGPATDFEFTVGDRTIAGSVTLNEGDVLVIDTDPRRQSTYLNGTRVRGLLSEANFAPIPAGKDRELTINVNPSGTVTATIAPRYNRAW